MTRSEDICLDIKQEIKNRWLTASGVKSYLSHLPEYTSVCTSTSSEDQLIANTIRELYKYSKRMFNLNIYEIEYLHTLERKIFPNRAHCVHNQGIIGAICGDIIGSPYEFNSTKDINFNLFTSKSKFTDDTVMTCAVAEWLMKDLNHTHGGLIKIMRQYGLKYSNVSYGNMFRIWLQNSQPKPYNSFGNGSAMRVSPVGFYASSLDEAIYLAKITAEVTHNHPLGIAGAQAVAATIYIMKKNSIEHNSNIGKKEVIKFLQEQYSYKVDYTEKEWKEHTKDYTFNETCQGSVPEAIYCALISNNYEQAIRNAVSLAGDADTQASIAGGVTSAYLPVPLDIIEKSFNLLPEELKKVIIEFNTFLVHREKMQNKEYPYYKK